MGTIGPRNQRVFTALSVPQSFSEIRKLSCVTSAFGEILQPLSVRTAPVMADRRTRVIHGFRSPAARCLREMHD